jgi:hypothetical protein
MEFSQIALQKLLQLFPELANFIITFKDVTEETNKGEDSDISVGVYILQFGDAYYYVPVMAKGEAVQPIDSIFNVADGTFTPLTKSFIQQASNFSQLSMGKSTKIPKTVNKNPSVYEMVTPPRTGKFVYASTSRLTEFLSIMPNMVKKAMLDKFSEDKEVYTALHRLFGLENVLASLKPTHNPITVSKKPAVEMITDGVGLQNDEVKAILEKGYALRGENTTERVAVLANDFSAIGQLKQLSSVDAGLDYNVVNKSGDILSAYLPKRSQAVPQFAALLRPFKGGDPVLAIYSNGDYSISGNMVARGEGLDGKNVLKDLFATQTPGTPRDVVPGQTFAILSPTLDLVGVFSALTTSGSEMGTSISAYNLIRSAPEATQGLGSLSSSPNIYSINASRNCTKVHLQGSVLFVPFNSLVITLKNNITNDLEINVNSAFAKLELNTLTALGTAADIGYDGIEFSYNGSPIGSEHKMVELLVIKEGIAPEKADSFIKQAKVTKHVKVYLSKVADFEPGEIPQFGDAPPEQASMWDFQNGDGVVPKLKDSLKTQDPQTVEATIISELLQVTNMKEYVREYLPDIKEAIDKLGRTLFLARLNMADLAKTHSALEVTSFVNNLRNVYRMLGDNYVKLEQMVSDSEVPETE